jgi:type II secretory pathway component PulJ
LEAEEEMQKSDERAKREAALVAQVAQLERQLSGASARAALPSSPLVHSKVVAELDELRDQLAAKDDEV